VEGQLGRELWLFKAGRALVVLPLFKLDKNKISRRIKINLLSKLLGLVLTQALFSRLALIVSSAIGIFVVDKNILMTIVLLILLL
jgi:hypothetical protein